MPDHLYRRGRLKFVAVAQLEAWLQRSAVLTLEWGGERRLG
jgi:hypothetical protein